MSGTEELSSSYESDEENYRITRNTSEEDRFNVLFKMMEGLQKGQKKMCKKLKA